jgi:hypothetical protein
MTIEEFYSNYSKIIALKANTYYTKIPILKSYTEEGKLIKSETVSKLKEKIQSNGKILDMGAGSKNFKDLLNKIGLNIIYKSMDIDKNNFHDYHSIEEINEKFDYVLLFNLLEHLPFETGLNYLTKAQEVLEKNGLLFISVPNIWHPNHMWRCDITHIKPYPYQDLFALLSFMGFKQIEMYRIYHRPFKLSIKKFIFNKFKIILYKIMELDFTKDLWMIAQKQ